MTMTPIFRYLEAEEDAKKTANGTNGITEKEAYFIQCEWYTKNVVLEDDDDKEYCEITITDLVDYWQCKVNCGTLKTSFPDSSALIQEARDRVLTDAFNGAHYEGAAPCSWAATKEPDSDKLRLILKTYLGKFAMKAGYFLVDKVDQDKTMNVRKTWHQNATKASHATLEAEVAHKKEIIQTKENLDELKESVQTLNRESFEYKLTMFSNFSKALDSKKDKIIELERKVEDITRKRKFEEVDVKVEEKEVFTSQLTATQSQKSTQKSTRGRKSSKSQQASQPANSSTSSSSNSQVHSQKKQKITVVKSQLRSPSPSSPSIDLTQGTDEEEEEEGPSTISYPSLPEDTIVDKYDSDEDLYGPDVF